MAQQGGEAGAQVHDSGNTISEAPVTIRKQSSPAAPNSKLRNEVSLYFLYYPFLHPHK
jgi:hypothetical protein